MGLQPNSGFLAWSRDVSFEVNRLIGLLSDHARMMLLVAASKLETTVWGTKMKNQKF